MVLSLKMQNSKLHMWHLDARVDPWTAVTSAVTAIGDVHAFCKYGMKVWQKRTCKTRRYAVGLERNVGP